MYFNRFKKVSDCIKSNNLYEANLILNELNEAELAPQAQRLFKAFKDVVGKQNFSPLSANFVHKNESENINAKDYAKGQLSFNINPVESQGAFFGKSSHIWNALVKQLKERQSIASNPDVQLICHMERYFMWDENDSDALKKPWLGVLHNPADIPEFYESDFTNKKLFETSLWRDNKQNCRGIITFSEHNKQLLVASIEKEIPIFVFDYPMIKSKRPWSFERFKSNEQKKLLQFGFYLRNLHSLYEFSGVPDFDKYLIRHSEMPYFKEKLAFCGERFKKVNQKPLVDDNVKDIGFLDEKYYDAWLSENIVFLELYAVNACSTLYKCISTATPILVNRLPALEELLGADYPLFYETKQAIPEILAKDQLVKQAHEHLFALPGRKSATINDFVDSVSNLSIFPNNGANPVDKLTVVTVVMNMPDLLERTIKSVIAQNYQNLEYVIIDGGSTDGTIDIIKKYQQHIDLWVSEPDKGIYDAMNKGGRLASGIWVNFLNAGDTFVSETTVTDMFTEASIEDDLVYGHTVFQTDGEEKIVEAREPEHLWQAMVFNHNSLFKKRNLLLEHPFSEQYKIVADSEFVIWCYTNGKTFKNVNFPINTYESGGYADMNSVMRTVERWKVVSDYKLKPQQEINDFYFQRLLWENPCKEYLNKVYKVKI